MPENFRRNKRHKQQRINFALKKKILGDNLSFNCYFCKIDLPNSMATIDHIIPLSLGGLNSVENVVLSCRKCNFERGKHSFKELKLIRKQKWL